MFMREGKRQGDVCAVCTYVCKHTREDRGVY